MCILRVAILVMTGSACCLADGRMLSCEMASPGVSGRKAGSHGWVEENVYAVPVAGGVGSSAQTARTPAGSFSIPLEAEKGLAAPRYLLFSLNYDGIPAFTWSCRPNTSTQPAVGEDVTLETPAHYSVMYNTGAQEWGENPWVSGDDFYQTFKATGPHITRIATRLADKSGDHAHLTLNYAVYETNTGPPAGWKLISPVRSRFLAGSVDPIIHIFHVSYRSEEIQLTVGRSYAVRLWRSPESQSRSFAMVARPDRGDGYADGCLYSGNEPLPHHDAFGYVSGGSAGTIVNHAPLDCNLKKLAGMGARFGQVFKASGTGLAAVDIVYTTGVPAPPAIEFAFQLYDRPAGKAIGPARRCRGLPLAYQGRAAAAWLSGEAPLLPGREYYIEWTCLGCNTWLANDDLPGQAWRDGRRLDASDLMMSIAEYEDNGVRYSPIADEAK